MHHLKTLQSSAFQIAVRYHIYRASID